MPERIYKSQQRYDSDQVQGPGSWVVIRQPTWGDLEELTKTETTETINEVEIGKKMIERAVVDWNWVDDNGEPMPAPSPEIVRALPIQEVLFLISKVEIQGLDPKALARG